MFVDSGLMTYVTEGIQVVPIDQYPATAPPRAFDELAHPQMQSHEPSASAADAGLRRDQQLAHQGCHGHPLHSGLWLEHPCGLEACGQQALERNQVYDYNGGT